MNLKRELRILLNNNFTNINIYKVAILKRDMEDRLNRMWGIVCSDLVYTFNIKLNSI